MRAVAVCLLGVLLALAPLLSSAQANDSRQARAELEQTQKEVEQLKKLLGGLQAELGGVERELATVERDIGQIRRQSRELQQQLQQGEQQLQQMQLQSQALEQEVAGQQQQIARQLRAAWMAGEQDSLRVLLSQDDPQRASRMLRYYQYLNRARMQEIQQYRESLTRLQQARAERVQLLADQQQRREQLKQREQQLAGRQDERNAVLANLRNRTREQSQQLKAREAERAELEQLVKRLDEAITRIPTPAGSQPFAQARGKLPLPVRGEIIARFGSQRGDDARMKWDGLVIRAPEGHTVHAIHGGRVVFADWLRGAGLLLILDHGNGYLSLYGHSQSLLRDVGSWVQPGEAIATVGSSGGQAGPSLYFSIRHQGRALDPAAWCML
ncbi:MAG: peptidoglycan DD-metalloendopeptidase family protein [Halopseudomonas yangmingensis]|uniref:Septal ring factor EnvC, activator of murein hydrolases AmiA and AmiB n=1 Tax=Halopseudomonas yangmingensis TaxID=1720063 RepID=A0A1I4PEZ3_9GAMM|nr:peptidoglycan DD-metalloendopeptidase family protein [Halopseudomonas yangmingensis]SFM26240.1 Septal ring factor EnvC, activator of murein hydrolases AmiA and AmiB [Halopseudomonas yangmingensis]